MRKIFAAILPLCVAAFLSASSAHAQVDNHICPTAPPGTSDDRCASTKFVMDADTIGDDEITIGPGFGGAVCDGTTLDTAAFQAAINLGISVRKPVRFFGTCRIGTLTIGGSVDFGGAGGGTIYEPSSAVSLLQLDSSTQDGIFVTTTKSVSLHDFQIRGQGTPSAGACIAVNPTHGLGANNNSFFERIFFTNCYNSLYGGNFNWETVKDNTFLNNFSIDLYISSYDNPDQIGANVSGNAFERFNSLTTPSTTYYGIYIDSSSVIRIQDRNRFDGAQYQIFFNLRSGVNAGELFIQGNSFENLAPVAGTSGAVVRIGCADSTGAYGRIIISNNEIASLPSTGGFTSYGVISDCPSSTQISHVIISNNMMGTNSAAGSSASIVRLVGVSGATIDNNICEVFGSGGTSVCFSADATSSNIYFGPQIFRGAVTTRFDNNVVAGSYNYAIGCQSGSQNIATGTAYGALFSGSDTITYPRTFDAAFPVSFSGGPYSGTGTPVSLGPGGVPGATSAAVVAVGLTNTTSSFYWQACGKLD